MMCKADMGDSWTLWDTGGRWVLLWMAMDGEERVTRRLSDEIDGLWWRRCAAVSVVSLEAADGADGPVLRVKLRVAAADRRAAFEMLAPGGRSAPPLATLFPTRPVRRDEHRRGASDRAHPPRRTGGGRHPRH
jgi:hypothetical protein